MDSIINLVIGELALSSEYIFVARFVAIILTVEVLTGILSAIVPIARVSK